MKSKEFRRTRSSSCSEYGETAYKNEPYIDYRRYTNSKNDKIERDRFVIHNDDKDGGSKILTKNILYNPRSILDPDLMLQYDYYKKIYADILYRWKLIEKRALLLRTIQSKLMSEKESLYHLPFATLCPSAGCSTSTKFSRNVFCSDCNMYSFVCCMCRTAVKGAANHCLLCGHGGHAVHMQDWFLTHSECPTGCGCLCIQPQHDAKAAPLDKALRHD